MNSALCSNIHHNVTTFKVIENENLHVLRTKHDWEN